MDKEKVSLNEIVEEAADLDIYSCKVKGIDAKIKYSKQCNEKRYDVKHSEPTIPSLEPSLFNIINNMVHNSNDALIQKYGKDNLNKGLIHIKTYKRKEYDVFEIKDNGIGMNEESKKRFFEIEYTTKPRGSGLGFIDFKDVLKELNGYYELESEVDKGTKFKLYFNPS